MEAKKPAKKKYPEYDPHRGCDGCVDPPYMGFVSAADFEKFMEKQRYYDMLFNHPQWTTELPKVEPYYSQCLKEFEDGILKVYEDGTKKQANKHHAKTTKKQSKIKPGLAANKNKKPKSNPKKKNASTNQKKPPPAATILTSTCKAPSKAAAFKPTTGHPRKNPTIESIGTVDPRDYTFPPNWPNMPSGYPKPESSDSGVNSCVYNKPPAARMCNHCMLLPCIVDAHFDQLLDINSESEVLLCDPPDITFRKLEAYFRRLIVKYFGLEYMKLLGGIPVCAEEKCHHLASRENTTEFEHIM